MARLLFMFAVLFPFVGILTQGIAASDTLTGRQLVTKKSPIKVTIVQSGRQQWSVQTLSAHTTPAWPLQPPFMVRERPHRGYVARGYDEKDRPCLFVYVEGSSGHLIERRKLYGDQPDGPIENLGPSHPVKVVVN